MANELRKRGGFVAGALSADLAIGATSMSSAGLADLPVIDSTDHAAITLFETNADGRVTKSEIVYVTAHTSSATSATIVKAQEGTTDQAWNGTSSPDKWTHGPTLRDFTPGRVAFATRTAGNLTTTSTSWVDLTTALDLTITAQAGDIIEYAISGIWGAETPIALLDVATMVSGSAVNYFGTGGNNSYEGVGAWYTPGAITTAISGSVFYVVQAGDIASGLVTLRPKIRLGSSSTKTIFATASDPLQVWAKNLGPQEA